MSPRTHVSVRPGRGVEAEPSPKDIAPFRIGVVGLAHGHVDGFFSHYLARPDVQIVGIVESDAGVAARAAQRLHFDKTLLYTSFDFGCYAADLATWLLDDQRPTSITAVTQQIMPDIYPYADDEATILVTYPKAQVIIQASWNWPFSRKDMEVYCQHGSVITVADNDVRVRKRQDRADSRAGRRPHHVLPGGHHGGTQAVRSVEPGDQCARHGDPGRGAEIRQIRKNHPAWPRQVIRHGRPCHRDAPLRRPTRNTLLEPF